MPGNDQSIDVDPYLRYIFGEENELEQVGEQELHRPVQTLWPIGSDIGVTVLGRTIDILHRRCLMSSLPSTVQNIQSYSAT